MRVLSGAALTASRRLSTSPATEEYIWRGAATNFRAWFDDAGDPLDLSGFTSLTLTLADSPSSDSETLATKTVLAASFGSATLAQFTAGTHQHATFSLSSDQTEITTSGVPSRTLYWQITGLASGETVRLGEGYIQLHGNGDSGPADPVSSYYTKAEADASAAGVLTLDGFARDWTIEYPERSSLAINYSTRTDGVSEGTTDRVVHPSVVRIPGGWNGYEYWMAITPYPINLGGFVAETAENPSILRSATGLNGSWAEAGSNPKCPIPSGYTVQGDVSLFYHEAESALIMHYGRSNGSVREICRSESTNGTTWTTPVVVMSSGVAAMGSPSLVKTASGYRLYYTDFASGAQLKYRDHADFRQIGSGSAAACSFTGNGSQVIWDNHVYYWDGVWFISAAFANSSGGDNAQLYFGTSADGIAWTVRKVLPQNDAGWPDYLVYTSAVLPVTASDGSITLDVWVSGTNSDLTWGFGKTTATPHVAPPHQHLPEHILGVTPGASGAYLDNGGKMRTTITPSAAVVAPSGATQFGRLSVQGTGIAANDGAVIGLWHTLDTSGSKQAGIQGRTRMTSRYLQTVMTIGQNDNSFGNAGTVTFAAFEFTDAAYANLSTSTEFAGWQFRYYSGTGYVIPLHVQKNGVFLGNSPTTPGTPTAGGILYVESGALKYKGSSGTVTTIANP